MNILVGSMKWPLSLILIVNIKLCFVGFFFVVAWLLLMFVRRRRRKTHSLVYNLNEGKKKMESHTNEQNCGRII